MEGADALQAGVGFEVLEFQICDGHGYGITLSLFETDREYGGILLGGTGRVQEVKVPDTSNTPLNQGSTVISPIVPYLVLYL